MRVFKHNGFTSKGSQFQLHARSSTGTGSPPRRWSLPLPTSNSAIARLLQRLTSQTNDLLQRLGAARLWRVLRSLKVVRRAGALLPLSVRGLLVVSLAAFCLFYYALPHSDLTASIISAFLLILTVALLLRGAFAARSVRRRLQASLAFDKQELFSQRQIGAGIILEQLRMPALYRVTLVRRFEHTGARSATHYVRGQAPFGDKLRLLDTCYFPHRGSWELLGLDVSLQDALGLTRFTWFLSHKELVEIQAPESEVKPLPIVAASSQPGDMLQHMDNRSGDLFDIKAYDPSDGTKRILWKTYAKSRQLVVRRPEPAMVPEGEVAIYSLARRFDDHVASAALAYIQQLRRNNIVVLLGADSLPSAQSADFAEHFVPGEAAKEVFGLDVWNPQLGSGVGFSGFIEALHRNNKYPLQVICYVDKARLRETDAKGAFSGAVATVRQHCAHYNVQPVFVQVDERFLNPELALRETIGRARKSGTVQQIRPMSFDPASNAIFEAERGEV